MHNPRINAVLLRWDRFRHQVHQRFEELLVQVQADCGAALDRGDDDTAAMSSSWTTMHARAAALGAQLHDSWNDQVEPRLISADATATVRNSARAQLEALQDRMEIELEATRLRIFADAARTLWARQRTTYEPNAGIDPVERFCVHALCEQAAWPQWLAMRQAELSLHTAHTETLALLQSYERAQIRYWDAYLCTRIGLHPDAAADYDVDLRNCMQPWYQHIEGSAAWSRAGRPSALRDTRARPMSLGTRQDTSPAGPAPACAGPHLRPTGFTVRGSSNRSTRPARRGGPDRT